MTAEKRDALHRLWDIFCSLRLTLSLLISLAAISIIGTIIPQGTPPPEYLAKTPAATITIYRSLGFFDMYHSWWFFLLLYLLVVNLVSCSCKRLPSIWKIVSQPQLTLSTSLEQSLPNRTSISSDQSPETVKAVISSFLASEFSRPLVTEADGACHLFAEKTPWCRLSVYCVHLSVIIILIGSIIGSLFGYKGFVTIQEGQSISKVKSRSGTEIDLGFSLRCERFSIARYATGAPKEFKSIITVLENGAPIPRYTNVRVIVNDPLTYRGITFYQSSYGDAGDYFFTARDLSGKEGVTFKVGRNASATLPDGSSMRIIEETDDVSQFASGFSGPAVQVEIKGAQGGIEKVVVYADHPEANIRHAREHNGGLVLQYKGARKKMYTGMQVAKDPGVWIVWAGCILMVAGIYAAFFLSHRRIWVRIHNGTVIIGGNASKNQAAFQGFYEALVDRLRAVLGEAESRHAE